MPGPGLRGSTAVGALEIGGAQNGALNQPRVNTVIEIADTGEQFVLDGIIGLTLDRDIIVPEPASAALFAAGLLLIARRRRRANRG